MPERRIGKLSGGPTLEGPNQGLWVECWLRCGARPTIQRDRRLSQVIDEVSCDEIPSREILLTEARALRKQSSRPHHGLCPVCPGRHDRCCRPQGHSDPTARSYGIIKQASAVDSNDVGIPPFNAISLSVMRFSSTRSALVGGLGNVWPELWRYLHYCLGTYCTVCRSRIIPWKSDKGTPTAPAAVLGASPPPCLPALPRKPAI